MVTIMRRASLSRRRLSSAGRKEDFLSTSGLEVVSTHLRSRSQERSVRLDQQQHHQDSSDALRSTCAASSTDGSENDLEDLEPFGSSNSSSSPPPSLKNGVKVSSLGKGTLLGTTSSKRSSSSSRQLKGTKQYHKRSASDPFDLAELEELAKADDATTTTLEDEVATTLPTLPRYPVAETRDLNCWSAPPVSIFKVRGPHYLKDKKKVPSANYLLQARGCDLLLFPDHAKQGVDMLQRRSSLLQGSLRKKPTLVLNFRFPWGLLLMYFEICDAMLPFLQHVPPEQLYANDNNNNADSTPNNDNNNNNSQPTPSLSNLTPGERTLAQWIMGDTHYKNQRLKLIPYVVEGPWVVRQMVTGKPAIIGTKLPVAYQYVPSDKLLVAELDIGNSSNTAKRIVSICRRYMNALTCDIGFVIQGNTPAELPEQMMGAIRIHGVDPLKAPTIV